MLHAQCNSFVYDEVLVSSEYYSFCLNDTTFSAIARMHQYVNRIKWREHIVEHIKRLNNNKAIKCSHSRSECVRAFDSRLKLKFHLQNIHCIELLKEIKRRRSNSEEEIQSDRKRRFKCIDIRDSDVKIDRYFNFTYEFVNETTKTLNEQKRQICLTSSISSQNSSSRYEKNSDNILSVFETSALSAQISNSKFVDSRERHNLWNRLWEMQYRNFFNANDNLCCFYDSLFYAMSVFNLFTSDINKIPELYHCEQLRTLLHTLEVNLSTSTSSIILQWSINLSSYHHWTCCYDLWHEGNKSAYLLE